MELLIAIMTLLASALAALAALIAILGHFGILSQPSPPSQLGAKPLSPPPEPDDRQIRSHCGRWKRIMYSPVRLAVVLSPFAVVIALSRRTIRSLVRWILAHGLIVIAFGLGAAAVGLPGGSLLLGEALLSSRPPDLQLLSPAEADVVPNRISVQVEARTLEQGEFLAVVVRPLPNEPFQSYFVQQPPVPVDGDRWVSQLVVVGAPDDAPGTLFDICAVITELELSPGVKLSDLPLGMSDCVRVTRE